MGRVVHFEIQADDVGRATTFYEKALGWKIKKYMTKEDSGMMDYWMVNTGEDTAPGINGGLYKRGDEKLHTYDCTIEVDDIDATIAAVKANGGKITKEKVEMEGFAWFARGVDTEGNIFGLMQPMKKK